MVKECANCMFRIGSKYHLPCRKCSSVERDKWVPNEEWKEYSEVERIENKSW